MTDHEQPESHPVDRELAAALDAAGRQVPKRSDDLIDAARAARDHHGRRRRRRIRAVTLGSAAAVILVVIGTALALGSGDPGSSEVASDDGSSSMTSAQGPASLPIPPDQAHEYCPDRPVDRDLGTAADGGSGPLLGFAPTEVIVCNYQGTEQLGGSVLIPADVERVIRGLAALDPVPDHLECTAEAGPTVGLIVTDGSRTETIWLQLYGCGLAFNGDNSRIGAKSLSWLTGQGASTSAPTGPATSANTGPRPSVPDDDGSSASPELPPPASSTPTPGGPPSTARPSVPGSAACPTVIQDSPADPVGADGTSPLLDFAPTKVVICTYAFDPVVSGVRTITDQATLSRIRAGLNALPTRSPERPCTAEKSWDFAIVASAESRATTIWAQHYGCGYVFDGDRVRVGAKTLSWLTP